MNPKNKMNCWSNSHYFFMNPMPTTYKMPRTLHNLYMSYHKMHIIAIGKSSTKALTKTTALIICKRRKKSKHKPDDLYVCRMVQ